MDSVRACPCACACAAQVPVVQGLWPTLWDALDAVLLSNGRDPDVQVSGWAFGAVEVLMR
jgi:hypothetical protein